MKRLPALLSLCLAAVAFAEDGPIRLSPDQIARSGIAVVPLAELKGDAGIRLPAQVIVPPAQIEVIAAPLPAMVATAALALLLLVRATEDSSRWYYLAIPTLVAAGLMRFNTLMLVLPMIMWIVMRSRPFRHARQILAGAGLSLLVYAQPAALYLARYSDILFPFTTALGMVETATTAGGQSNLGESAAGGWYALNTPALLGGERIQAAAVVVLLIALTGLMLAAVRYFDRHRPTRARWFFAALGVGAALLGQTGGSLITFATMKIVTRERIKRTTNQWVVAL